MDIIIRLKIFNFIYLFSPRKKSETSEAEGIVTTGSSQAIIGPRKELK